MPSPRPHQPSTPPAENGPQPTPAPTHRWRRGAGALAVLGVAGIVAAGCGASGTKTSTAAAAPAATSAPAKASAATGTATITARLTEFKITLSRTPVAPGTYTFDAVDAGHTVHALEVTGPGITKATTSTLHPGQSADLSVTLQAGKYDVFCPVGDHKMLGMDLELTIGGGSSAAAPAVATSPTTVRPSGGTVGY